MEFLCLLHLMWHDQELKLQFKAAFIITILLGVFAVLFWLPRETFELRKREQTMTSLPCSASDFGGSYFLAATQATVRELCEGKAVLEVVAPGIVIVSLALWKVYDLFQAI